MTRPILTVRLPNGRPVALNAYVIAWRQLREVSPDLVIRDWADFPTEARRVLAQMREGMHDRINRHVSSFGRGRKWSSDWQRSTGFVARAVNTRRLVVRAIEVPREFRARLAGRLEV